ncbi:Cysteine-rich receptor-like protein kinase [Sesamum angolense]|uniref:Cysteine-rich receptor-like protein kinase n=1 Tax=Sesamum angolense TaxID=2727404 RepID=A0AAE1WB60_9LAMI|nr:Cysteine-rich receptor-like protein kinase [Sesamum angolense]
MAVFIFLILTTLFALVSSQGAYDPVYNCYPDYNPSNSQYTTSLNTLLPSLSSNIGDDGFYSASEGPANAIVLCRGDIQLDECRVCVSMVAQRIVQDCPDRMRAIIWALNCTLRYSDERMLGAMATTPNINSTYSNLNVTSPDRFKGALETLMNDLRSVAAKGSSGLKAAADIGSGPDGQTIYAMLQCTPDLSNEGCDSCLSQAAELIPTWYPIGARIYMPSCTIRYENFSFYNITRLQESRDQPPTVLPPPSSGSR